MPRYCDNETQPVDGGTHPPEWVSYPQARIDELLEARRVLITYLEHKAQIRDWHGVSDAANDLRVLEAKIEALDSARKGS